MRKYVTSSIENSPGIWRINPRLRKKMDKNMILYSFLKFRFMFLEYLGEK